MAQMVPLAMCRNVLCVVSFDITPDKLAFYDINMNHTVEAGDFEVMIGGSSEDVDMLKTVFTVE